MANLFGVVIQTLNSEIQPGGKSTIALQYGDHLLRRFGLAEYLEPDSGQSPELRLRPEADEIWVVLSGSVAVELFDRRSDSPTQMQSQKVELQAPGRILIPFGVAAGWKTLSSRVQLLRFATHSEDESAVEYLPWKEA